MKRTPADLLSDVIQQMHDLYKFPNAYSGEVYVFNSLSKFFIYCLKLLANIQWNTRYEASRYDSFWVLLDSGLRGFSLIYNSFNV